MNQHCLQCGKEAKLNAKFCPGCGAPLGGALPQVQRLQPGQIIHGNSFRILHTLGKGGMGLVYLAENKRTFDRRCVIKEMLDYFDPNDQQQKATARQRFEDEARILSRLNHPGIPSIQDYFEENSHYYIVMDYVDGQNLEQMLGRHLPESQVVGYGVQVCEILEYLAGLSPPVVHHDIKPANIIVDASANRACLVDFGTAKARLSIQPGGGVGVQKSSIYGTVGYAPPEQYKGQSEPRSDVYALAATLYHLLTNDDPGEHAFSFPQLSSLSPHVSTTLAPCFEAVQHRCTAQGLRLALHRSLSAPKQPAPASRKPAALVHALPAHESYAVISHQLPPPVLRPQVIHILQAQLGLADIAAEVLTWQAPATYMRGVDDKRAEALHGLLSALKFNVNVVRTSQILSWRNNLGQSALQQLAAMGEVTINRLDFSKDRVCHCYACGHQWTTQAQNVSRLRNTCSKGGITNCV